MSILFILYIDYAFTHTQHTVLRIAFYNKLYSFSQKILTCMLNLSIQPVFLLCRLTAGFHIRALVAIVLYSIFQPFNFFGSSDHFHSHLLLPTIIISQKARFITFILWNSFILSSIVLYPQYTDIINHILILNYSPLYGNDGWKPHSYRIQAVYCIHLLSE